MYPELHILREISVDVYITAYIWQMVEGYTWDQMTVYITIPVWIIYVTSRSTTPVMVAGFLLLLR